MLQRPGMLSRQAGKWKPRKIPNPDYFEDSDPYKMAPIGAIGLELWSMSDDIVFDNFIITDTKSVADVWAADTWEVKRLQEVSGGSSAKSVVQAVLDATHERPWLWAVLIVVILLPIVLLIAYCCMPGSSKDAAAAHKKTDSPIADDLSEEPEESDLGTNEGGDMPTRRSSRKTRGKKSDLDADPSSEPAENTDADQSPRKGSPTRRRPRIQE
ncbi:hypothetical protein LSAT2_031602 [Lamellibrachia satsuma]|nr:hypothetical protein LSAT2_031602 [Lamellibrachia satsuma]